MNPITPLLLLLGYGIALPIGAQLNKVVERGNGVALAGHQVGVMLAGLGWLISGRWFVVMLHVGWIAVARVWFWWAGRASPS